MGSSRIAGAGPGLGPRHAARFAHSAMALARAHGDPGRPEGAVAWIPQACLRGGRLGISPLQERSDPLPMPWAPRRGGLHRHDDGGSRRWIAPRVRWEIHDLKRHGAPPIEVRIAAIASLQHGVLTRAQLLEAGLTSDMVDGRVRSGRLCPLQRGVYLNGALVGPLEPERAREMAAVLACGPGALVSHESAAFLWALLHPHRGRVPVHVTIPGADRGRRPGIRPHRVTVLPPEDRTVVDGVPVTTPARTIVDLAARVRPRVLEQVTAAAMRRDLADQEDVADVLARKSGARGAPLLRRLMATRRGPAFTRSEAEERFLTLIRGAGLPDPETNVHVGGSEVDFLWRAERVIVEVDQASDLAGADRPPPGRPGRGGTTPRPGPP